MIHAVIFPTVDLPHSGGIASFALFPIIFVFVTHLQWCAPSHCLALYLLNSPLCLGVLWRPICSTIFTYFFSTRDHPSPSRFRRIRELEAHRSAATYLLFGQHQSYTSLHNPGLHGQGYLSIPRKSVGYLLTCLVHEGVFRCPAVTSSRFLLIAVVTCTCRIARNSHVTLISATIVMPVSAPPLQLASRTSTSDVIYFLRSLGEDLGEVINPWRL